MQANTITLAVDVLNNATTEDSVFRRHEETTGRSTYVVDASHSLETRDMLQFYRTPPKRNGESRGSSKCAAKFTLDSEVPNASGSGNILLPQIAEVSFSLPVGTTAAQTLELRQRIIALLDDDAVMAPLNDVLEI